MVIRGSERQRYIAGSKLFLAVLALLIFTDTPALPQAPASSDAGMLVITGAVERSLNLQISDLEKMPHLAIEVKDHDGKVTTYEGVPMVELLKAAGAPIGEKLKGANVASYLLAEARDGYRVVFALAELDPAFTDSTVLVAYAANGRPLPDSQGPLRIVAPREKRPARWIRMLQRIQVVKIQ